MAQLLPVLLIGIVSLTDFLLAEKKEPLAQVGEIIVYREDLDFRCAVYERCYPETKQDEVNVLAELLRDALEEAVLLNVYGMSPSDSILDEKAKWIDENTKAPDVLSCIKGVYGKNKKAYLRNVVSSTLVNPTLHAMFSADKVIHNEEWEKIQSIFHKVYGHPEILPEIPEYEKFEVMKEVPRDERLAMVGATFASDSLIEKVLMKLAPGEMYDKIIEDGRSYKIVRFLSENSLAYVCEGVIVEQKPFDSWFQNYVTEHIPIKIYDKYLREFFQERYPNLWWLNPKNHRRFPY